MKGYLCFKYVILTVAPFEASEVISIFSLRLSQMHLHMYRPMPVDFSSFLPLLPVKNASNTLGISYFFIPTPESFI